jgi:hypothetical protein
MSQRNRWTYTVHRQAIRNVLENGLAAGTSATAARVRELISFLSTFAETGYLDLVRSSVEPPDEAIGGVAGANKIRP